MESIAGASARAISRPDVTKLAPNEVEELGCVVLTGPLVLQSIPVSRGQIFR